MKKYIIQNTDNAFIEGYPEIISKLLFLRGINTREDAELFFTPYLRNLSKPDDIPDLHRLKDFIEDAIGSDDTIGIYGDYDVDGIVASVLLARTIQMLGGKYYVHLPDRFEEGYGLQRPGIDKLHGLGIKKMITVDCGITAVKEIEYAKDLGIDVLITDHHLPSKELPDTIIINPKLHSQDSAYYDLSAGGIILFLIILCSDNEDFKKWAFSLAAISTLADIVPLSGDNRIIVKLGINALNTMKIEGIEDLMNAAGMKYPLDAYKISFMIAPRINASGRIENAEISLKLLLGENTKENANILNELNNERKKIQEDVLKRANELVDNNDPAIIIESKDLRKNVNGIVCSKMIDKYGKVTILFQNENGILEGSGRSIEGVDLMKIISGLRHYLISGGGHKMACGLKIKPEHFNAFKNDFIEALKKEYPDNYNVQTKHIDIECSISDFTMEVFDLLNKMEPFGIDNKRPLYLLKGVSICEGPILLKDKYKKYRVSQNDLYFDMIDWSGETDFRKFDTINAIGVVELNCFRGKYSHLVNIYDHLDKME